MQHPSEEDPPKTHEVRNKVDAIDTERSSPHHLTPDEEQQRPPTYRAHSSSDGSGTHPFSPWPSASTGSAASPAESYGFASTPFGGLSAGSSWQCSPPQTEEANRKQALFKSSGSLGPLDHAFGVESIGTERTSADSEKPSLRFSDTSEDSFARTPSHNAFNFSASTSWQSDQFAQPRNNLSSFDDQRRNTDPTSDERSRKMQYNSNAAALHQSNLESLRTNANERFDSWLANPRQGWIDLDGSVDTNSQTITSSQHHLQQQFVSSSLPLRQSQEYAGFAGHSMPSHQSQSNTPYTAFAAANEVRASDNFSMQRPSLSVPSNVGNPALGCTMPLASLKSGEQEFSVFVGDLCPNLREEDLVGQFLHPPLWPPSHPFAIAHAHAQQAQGNFGTPPKIGPAPFLSTKSATVMTDPLTGASRGFGFVRFTCEADCARALIEMQGVIIQPMGGHGGRPLRVCPATPKNRSSANANLQAQPSGMSLQDKLLSAISLPDTGPLGRSTNSGTSTLSNIPVKTTTTGTDSLASFSTSANDPSNTTVFVGGLSSLISEDTLKTFFVPFGEIKYVKIPPGKGCGFVQFVRKADAERAIERMQGFPIGGGRIRLSWGRSQGDKAAAAAAHAAAQAAQIGRLAGLAGLNASSTSQLTAATLAGTPPGSLAGNDAHSLLIKRLAAAAQVGTLPSAVVEKAPTMDRTAAVDSVGQNYLPYRSPDAPIPSPYSFPWSERDRQHTPVRSQTYVSDYDQSNMMSGLDLHTQRQNTGLPTSLNSAAEFSSAVPRERDQTFLVGVFGSDNESTAAADQRMEMRATHSAFDTQSTSPSQGVMKRSPLVNAPDYQSFLEPFSPFGPEKNTPLSGEHYCLTTSLSDTTLLGSPINVPIRSPDSKLHVMDGQSSFAHGGRNGSDNRQSPIGSNQASPAERN